MSKPVPNEVWQVDLGMTAKVRPCLNELALIVVVPHTTAVRGNRWEWPCRKPFLRDGAFHLQQIQPVSLVRFERRLGFLTASEFGAMAKVLIQLLHLAI